MTEAIYLEVTEKTEAAKKAGRQVSVSGMLKFQVSLAQDILHGSTTYLLIQKNVVKL